MNFSLDKQMERVVEVLALSALMANNPSKKIEKRLNEIAFPAEIKFEKEVKGICSVVHCMNTHKDVEMVESGTGETIICVSCLERD